jgi:transposase
VDALGNPTSFVLTLGQASDLDGADVLLKDTAAQTVIADKGYDAEQRVVEPLLKAGKTVVIPSICTRTVQRELNSPNLLINLLYRAWA